MAKLTDICSPKQWKTIGTSELSEIGYPVYGANGVIGYYSEYNHEFSTLLITCRGATCGEINISVPKSYINGNAMCLDSLSDEYDLRFLYHYLKWYDFDKVITGSAQPQITISGLSKVHVPDIPIEMQRTIAATLDKVTHLIDLCNAILEKLDLLVKARFVEMFGDPVDNPLGWNKKQLQEIVSDDCTISYGIVQTGDDQVEGVPVFRPVDIVNRIPVLSELKKTTKEISDRYKRTILRGHELLITVRANIADTCIVGEEFAGCNVGRGIVPLRTKETIVILEFLKYQLDNRHLNDRIKSKAKGITLVQLNMEDLRLVELIVPPIELQKSYVSFAKQTDKSKLAVKQVLEKAETLKKALMQEYFG